MLDADSLVRPRLSRGYATTPASTHRLGWARLSLLVLIAILSLGCGSSSTERSPSGSTPRSRPQLDFELPEQLAALVDGLYSEVPADRAYAASQLAELGPEAGPAAPFLIDVLKDANWQVRRQAAEALGAVGDLLAVDPLVEVLSDRDGDWSVRAAAARSLGQLGDRRGVEPLVAVLNDMNAHVRHMAVRALGQIGTPETMESLVAAGVSDSDGATRFSAVRAIRQMENTRQ